jgi:IS1 family transposase
MRCAMQAGHNAVKYIRHLYETIRASSAKDRCKRLQDMRRYVRPIVGSAHAIAMPARRGLGGLFVRIVCAGGDIVARVGARQVQFQHQLTMRVGEICQRAFFRIVAASSSIGRTERGPATSDRCGTVEGEKRPISTSLVDRPNLTMRMSIRRFKRRANVFSKTLENLQAAVAIDASDSRRNSHIKNADAATRWFALHLPVM